MTEAGPASPAPVRRAGVLRLVVAAVLQLPAVAIATWGQPPWAPWVAAVWGAGVLIAATDSGWRWTNRLLVVLAALWLLYALAG
jgi:hypothetical protein